MESSPEEKGLVRSSTCPISAFSSGLGGNLAAEQADPHLPGGVEPPRGDPAAGPQLPALLRQNLRRAAPVSRTVKHESCCRSSDGPFLIFFLLLLLFYRKKELLQGIYIMGFNRPSKIQETALPIMLAYP
uniref:RNA helicase n=1 Tax=Calidris pygmaea TaxID=425635 RepID=A0A8C3PJ83_9CHAR